MKSRTLAVVSLSACVALLLSVGTYAWFFWSPWGTLIRGAGYEGLLTPASKLPERAGPWTPTRGQIDKMEQELALYVKGRETLFGSEVVAKLPSYRRNYTCVTKQGQRLIAVDLYAPSMCSRRAWLNGVIIDGGAQEDNWSIYYDAETRAFANTYPFNALDPSE